MDLRAGEDKGRIPGLSEWGQTGARFRRSLICRPDKLVAAIDSTERLASDTVQKMPCMWRKRSANASPPPQNH